MGRRCCQTLFVVVIIGLEFLDVISDWLLYADVSIKEKGLVYGPPEENAIHALLAFSVIGTVAFLLEGLNLYQDEFYNNACLDTDLVAAITIWVEDIPQIALNVYIAHCREDPISVFQLSKASVVLFGLLIRIIISFVRCRQKAVKCKGSAGLTECKKKRVYWAFIMIGLFINSGCAIAVFIFTQGQRDNNGGVTVQEPTSLFEDEYNDQRYFQHVGVFIHHPDFDDGTPGATANWVRLMDINDIRNKDSNVAMNYVYEKTNTHLRLAVYHKGDTNGFTSQDDWRLSECYHKDLRTMTITTVDESACKRAGFFTGAESRVFITFCFTPPGWLFKKLIFGDIKYYIKVFQSGICAQPTNLPAIHYFRTHARISSNDTRHLLMEGGRPRFYHSDNGDLVDISEVWKTGFGGCESSGSLAPHLDTDIAVECSNIH